MENEVLSLMNEENSDLPEIWIYLGLSLIVFSGIYIFIRENKKT